MPTLLTIVTTSDILDDAATNDETQRDPDVRTAIETDPKARDAADAARRGRLAVKNLAKENGQ
jgi:hypothetical protein